MEIKFLTLMLSLTLAFADSPDVGLTQICIWLPIGLTLIVFYAVYLMMTMTSERDPLLHAKFLSTEADRR